jgi:transcriptional regulator with XRE-family HTH domain
VDLEELPVIRVTADQIVARNIRYFRKAAGLTQEELGELTGWTAANISAAERSADDGRDRRRFDAQTVITFARALDVPLNALFLPPADEGTDRRYAFNASDDEDGEWLGMGDLIAVVYPENGLETPAMDKYRYLITIAVQRLMNPEWAKDLARWLRKHESRDAMRARLARLRTAQYSAADALGDIRELADGIQAELEAGDEP